MSSSGVLSTQSRPTTLSLLPSMPTQPRHRHRDRIGPHRRAQRERAAPLGIMMRRLQHQIAPRPVHPIKQDDVADGFEPLKAFDPARIELDGAHGVGFARVFRAVFAPFPRACGCGRCNRARRRTAPAVRRRFRLRASSLSVIGFLFGSCPEIRTHASARRQVPPARSLKAGSTSDRGIFPTHHLPMLIA